ncbi:MAG: amylo-alpha-1,6-glucosidase [Bryobacteraceae bacterium]|nr:amylo-alpha-1,6-glucosidase [Bryobacteraceae bacterium]
MLSFDERTCSDLGQARRLEWLETNGIGGFASSTIAGLNTRRYHALLTAATKPPAGRMVLLSKLEETLVIDGKRFDLSANEYPGAVHPQGFRLQTSFRLDPFPIFTWRADAVEIEKRVFLVHGENTVVVEYELTTPAEATLEVRPLIAFRDYHSTTRRNDALNPAVEIDQGLASVEPYAGLPRLYFAHNAAALWPHGDWYFNFEYDVERERGLDFTEDLFNPFVLTFDLTRRTPAAIVASTERRRAAHAGDLRRKELKRRASVRNAAPCEDLLVRRLTAAADQFLVKRGEQKTIIAGYPWFTDWGRDTMIALPGLTLATGRHEDARQILEAFAQAVSQGMLPNRFPDFGEEPEYNTVDATLWFFEAARAYEEYTGDTAFLRTRLYPVLRDIVEWHLKGARHGIAVDGDGLLKAGEPGVQLTWMDAKVGDWVVTPRHGKPVEVQALWYNALRVLADFAHRFGDASAAEFSSHLARRVAGSVNALFWNAEAGCLYDVVGPDGRRDAAIRPNQILAVSLPHTMVRPDRARAIVEVVTRELLTPLGLRTLSPSDPAYRPRYEGGVDSRDSAYHQGTVWPWLLGPFLSAYMKVNNRSEASRRWAKARLDEFAAHLDTAGLNQVSEIADADAPHTPRGCFAQAWSVAELLRVAVEDVYECRTAPRALLARA